jgi:hypothetical protein
MRPCQKEKREREKGRKNQSFKLALLKKNFFPSVSIA